MTEYGLTEEDLEVWLEYTRDIPKKAPRRRFFKPLKQPYPATLDLHGFTMQEGFERLKAFISTHHALRTRRVVVVTGRGRADQSFMHKVPRWLQEKYFERYVSSFVNAPAETGGEGALIVRIRQG